MLSDTFSCVRVEGSILPTDLLQRVAGGDARLDGLRAEDYGLVGEKVNEATNHAWTRLSAAWDTFNVFREKLPQSDPGYKLTIEKWLLPFWKVLGYSTLDKVTPFVIDDKTYPVTHVRHHSPFHLVSFRQDLDKRVDTDGKQFSPHGLVQELLNRSDNYLWGFVSNGFKLRVLRDNIRLTRQAYVEFDLQAMFDGKQYADFALLWRVCHESRVNAEKPEQCWLERWSKVAAEQGLRALDQLRTGVENAVKALGRGFLSCPANTELKAALKNNRLSPQDYYRQLLRVVYRFLFLFVAEDRELLFDPAASDSAKDRYNRFYSTARLRRMAERLRGTPHTDLFEGFSLILTRLGTTGCPDLGLPAIGGLFDPVRTPHLSDCRLANSDLLEAIRALAVISDGQARRSVDYRSLGAEELGSVYESLLELQPRFDPDAITFTLQSASGNERKTTGSYYTPTSLITCLLDSALDPVLTEAAKKPNSEAAILNLKVCDPACGSGHFLIAAAHRIAKKLASVRTQEDEPAPDAIRHALRDVIGRCIFGVDINPMAVELCQVALWMEALKPGKPLSFLDHHIQCGNSLLGTTPTLLANGIPDEAFEPIEGDEKAVCRERKRLNHQQREDREQGQGYLFAETEGSLLSALAEIDQTPDDTLEQIHAKEERYRQLMGEANYRTSGHLLADLWCSAFVVAKRSNYRVILTDGLFRTVERNPEVISLEEYAVVRHLAEQYRFLHWHLAFPGVFRLPAKGKSPDNELTGWCGGFDAVLGNPPWVRQEMLKPIKQLLQNFQSFSSTADSSVFFLELGILIARVQGRVGLLTPNKWFRAGYAENLRRILREASRIDLLVDFGHSRTLFPDVDTFPAAIVLEPVAIPSPEAVLARFVQAHDSDRDQCELQELVRTRCMWIPHSNLRPERWQLEESGASELLDRLLKHGVPLESVLDKPIIRGILSGFNEAFYVDTTRRNAIVDANPEAEPLFKRFLRGRDVKRWTPLWGNQWHIVIPSSVNRAWPWSNATNEADAERLFSEAYPSVYAHLKQFEQQLRARQDKGMFWWELRPCDYYQEFENPKLVVQCIAYYSQFAFDDKATYVNNKAIVIPTDSYYVLAILNSRVIWWVINRIFQHMKDEGLSVDVQFLKKLPIPSITDVARNAISQLAGRLIELSYSPSNDDKLGPIELALDRLVGRAFDLSESEFRVMMSSLPPRDPIQPFEAKGLSGVRPIAPLTSAQFDMLKAMAYVAAFVHAWKNRVESGILETGLVLMVNDALRKAYLTNTSIASRQSGRHHGKLLDWMPLAVNQMLSKDAIKVDPKSPEGLPFYIVGPSPFDLTNLGDYVKKAEEAVKVIKKIGEQKARTEVEECIDDPSNLVPV